MGHMKTLYTDFCEKYEAVTIEELQEELELYLNLQSSGVSDQVHISLLESLIADKLGETV
jgi:hypothetical protein